MNDNIKELLFLIRNKQVMLDSDVAMLYDYETKRLNEAVKRNIRRFPEELCFQLTEMEYAPLKSQIATSNKQYKYLTDNSIQSRGGKQKLPYVFTEKGIIMLAGLLKSETAISVSLKIVEAFVEMRKFILSNNDLFEQVITIKNTVTNKFLEHDKRFDEIFDYMQKEQEVKQRIFFSGQIFEAYYLIVELIKKANKNIIIIDNYIDETILALLEKKKQNVNVIIITSNKSSLNKIDISKFNEQFPRLKITYANDFHDRFIIIDGAIYHCGASLKDLGKKSFAINKIEDILSMNELSKKIKEVT